MSKKDNKKKGYLKLIIDNISMATIIGIGFSIFFIIWHLTKKEYLWAIAWVLLFILYSIDIYDIVKDNKK